MKVNAFLSNNKRSKTSHRTCFSVFLGITLFLNIFKNFPEAKCSSISMHFPELYGH